MSGLSKITGQMALGAVIFIFGALYGRYLQKQQHLQEQLYAYKQIGKIDNAIQSMDNYTLCRKLGGLRKECAALIPRPHTPTKNKPPSKACAK